MSSFKNLPSFSEMLGKLVATPSISSRNPKIDIGNLPVLEHLADWLTDLGFKIELQPMPNTSGKGNLIATLGNGNGGLVLAGHSDTVPFDANQWRDDPFKLSLRDDRYFGLGTCDMKGFFPVAIEAIATLIEAGQHKRFTRPLRLIVTADEESTMAGARYLADTLNIKADAAVIGEPTNLTPIYTHKGVAFINIALTGKSGHSSNPSQGSNALDGMNQVINNLIHWRQTLASHHHNPAFEVSIPTVNLGCLHAGDSPNRICADAVLQLDLRTLPGMNNLDLIEEIQTQAVDITHKLGINCEVTTHYPPIPPFQGNPNGELARTLASWSGRQPASVAFATEGHYFQQLGMETIVFGPGSIDQAHQPNEFLSLQQITEGRSIISQLIEQYCIKPAPSA